MGRGWVEGDMRVEDVERSSTSSHYEEVMEYGLISLYT